MSRRKAVQNAIFKFMVLEHCFSVFYFLHNQPDKTKAFFKKEDPDQKLWLHMEKHDVWSSLPLSDWFSSCFAGVLPDQSFERFVVL